MAWISTIRDFVSSFFEVASMLAVLTVFEKEKQKSGSAPKFIFSAAIAAYTLIISLCNANQLFMLLNYVAIAGFSVLVYKFPIKKGIFLTCFTIIFVGTLELLMYILLTFLYKLEINNSVVQLVVVGMTYCISFAISQLKLSKIQDNLSNDSIKGYYYSIFACVMVIVTVMYFKFNKGISVLEGIYLLIAIGVVLVSAYKISVYRYELRIQKEYSEVYGEVVSEIRERQHKFTSQLDAVYSLTVLYDNYEELVEKMREKLESLRYYIMPAKLLILEEPLVIAHVYQKQCEAVERNIEMEMQLSCSLHNLGVPEIYLVEIIGNLLDNAMDEIVAGGLGEKLYLEIFPQREYGQICIQVLNEHEKILPSVFSEFFKKGYSSKGKNRGEGLPYVKKIVNKYRGKLEVGNIERNGKNCFFIKVMFWEKAVK